MNPDEIAAATNEQLTARAAEIRTRLEAIDTEAGNEPLAAERSAEWETLETENGTIDTETTMRDRREQIEANRRQWSNVRVNSAINPHDGEDVTRMAAGAVQDRARALLDSRDAVVGQLSDEQKTRFDGMLTGRTRNCDGAQLARRMLITEQPEYREAFMRLVTRAAPVLTPEQSRAVQQFEEFRAMSIGTDSEGGFGVPVLIDPTIILTAQGSPNPFFRLARVETITNDKWKGVTSAGASWQFRVEASPASDNSPTLASPEVPAHRADGYIPYSIEVDSDYPGFASEMQTLLSEGYSELLVNKFTTGTGTNEPTGIVAALNGTASEVDTATAGAVAVTDVNGLWSSLPIRYRNANAAWMSHTSINDGIQQLASGNDAAFTVTWTAEGVSVLKGHEAVLNDYLGELGGAVDGLLIVGDWQNYLIAQRAGMSIELIPHVFSAPASGTPADVVPTGQRAWFAWARVGADSVNDAGFRMLSDDGV